MYKAIVVDDEEVIVNGLVKLLPWEKYHCQVVGSAENGFEAMDLMRKYQPQIIFTDIRMPQMDGLALISAIKSEYPQSEITILSGHGEFSYAQQAISFGVRNYILKPSKMDELEKALGKMVQKLKEKQGSELGEKEEREKAGHFVVSNAMEYIKENYHQKLTLPEVAKQVYVSQWHLSKLIAKETGDSFNDLLNGIRIEEAKKLLQNPAFKIWEISEKVGFGDVAHFSRVFKKTMGLSANEYRNKEL